MNEGTYVSYNDDHHAWTQRLKKELWTKDELKNFGSDVNGDTIRNKFGLKAPEKQTEMDLTARNKLDKLRQ